MRCAKCIHHNICYYEEEVIDPDKNNDCEDFEEVRPNGEWIPKQSWDNTHIWVCSRCGNQNRHGITIEKACWKCGAVMEVSE